MARKATVHEGQWGGQWSIKKLDSVENYLRAYLFVMKNAAPKNGWHLLYIDAFSGSGSQHINKDNVGEIDLEGNEITDFVEGSTMRALKVTELLEGDGTRGFEHFDFIDIDKNALALLRENVGSKHPSLLKRCEFRNGDSNILLPEILDGYDWNSYRGVIFIDPFRSNFNRKILEKVAMTHALDVWFLFPLYSIGRMLALDGNKISSSWEKKLDDFFGTHDWYPRLYKEEMQPTLFSYEEITSTRSPGYDELLIFTKEWLQGIFGKNSVLDPLRLNGSNNSPLFALFAAISSNSSQAIKVWKDIAKHILQHA